MIAHQRKAAGSEL